MEKKKYVPTKEIIFYCIGATGQGMTYGIMSSYISDFYLNVLKLAPVFVLLLMFFARIWDAINDTIMGAIVDRSNPKHGKMKAYILYMPFPVMLMTIFMFMAPDLSDTGKMIFAGVTYVAWGMLYTAGDIPFWSLPNALTPNADERGKIIGLGRTTNGVGAAVPMAMFMGLGFILPSIKIQGQYLAGTELEKTKYTIMSLFCAIVGALLFFLVYFKTKERVNIPIPKKEKKEKGQPSNLKIALTCKPLIMTALMGIISAARYMFQAGAVHVARYSFYIGEDPSNLTGEALEKALQGNISKVSTILAMAAALGMFGSMLAATPLMKKFSYKTLVIVSSIMGSASSLAMWFIGYNHFWACAACLVVSTIPCGIINVCAFAMAGDCLDYMEYTKGVRLTGLGFAIQSFVTKFSNAIATSFIILMYFIVDLDVANMSAAVTVNPLDMPHEVRQGIFSIVSIIPAFSLGLCIIPMFFYNLTGEYKENMEKELAERRAAQGIEIME